MPTLLHFANNAVVFGVSAHKVARKLLAQHADYVALNERVTAAQSGAARAQARAAAAARGGPGPAAGGMVDRGQLELDVGPGHPGFRMRRVDIGALNSRLH